MKHLVEWSRGFLEGAGIELPALDVEADPAGAWKQHVTDIQAILDDPAGRLLSNPHTGDKPVDEAIDQFYTTDVWMHSWDLAKALRREFDLGEERCSGTLAAIAPMEQLLRDSGQFGPPAPVAPDASPQDKLVRLHRPGPGRQPEGGRSGRQGEFSRQPPGARAARARARTRRRRPARGRGRRSWRRCGSRGS